MPGSTAVDLTSAWTLDVGASFFDDPHRLADAVLVLPLVTGSAELCVACHASMRISPECTRGELMHVSSNVSCWAVAEDAGELPLPRPPPSACGRTVLRKQCPTPQQPNNFAHVSNDYVADARPENSDIPVRC